MKFSLAILSAFTLSYAATNKQVEQQQQNTGQAMSGYQGSMTNYRQVMDTLNERLKSDDGSHTHEEHLVAFITGADSQIDNAISTVSDALAPYTLGISKAIGNVLLGPFVQSVTNGAEVMVANLIGNSEDRVDAQMVGQLTGNYSRLIELSTSNNVETTHLQNLNQQISNTIPKSKRAQDEYDDDSTKAT